MRRTRVRAARGHNRGETEDGDDCVCLSDGDGLHPQYGFREAAEQHCEQRSIMSRRLRFVRVRCFRCARQELCRLSHGLRAVSLLRA